MKKRLYSFLPIAGVACCVACGSETNLGGFEGDGGPYDAARESAVDSGTDGPPADARSDAHDTDVADGGGGEGGACNPGIISVAGSLGVPAASFCDGTTWWWTNPAGPLDAGPRNEILIGFNSQPDACGSGWARSGATLLQFIVHASDALLVPRTYSIVPAPKYGEAYAYVEYPGGGVPTSGTLSITAMSGTMLSATFDLTFPDGTVTGSFDVPVCEKPFN